MINMHNVLVSKPEGIRHLHAYKIKLKLIFNEKSPNFYIDVRFSTSTRNRRFM